MSAIRANNLSNAACLEIYIYIYIYTHIIYIYIYIYVYMYMYIYIYTYIYIYIYIYVPLNGREELEAFLEEGSATKGQLKTEISQLEQD